MGTTSTNVFCGGVSNASFTNTLVRKKKSARNKATREEESGQEVCGPEKSPEHILASTITTSVGKYFVATHFESPTIRKTTSLLSG